MAPPDRPPNTRGRSLLLVITRAPIPGFAKTRLGATIGMDNAARLHQAFLTDIARTFFEPGTLPGTIDRGWAFTPETYDFRAFIRTLAPSAAGDHVVFVEQAGDGLGERLTNCFSWAHERGYQDTVIMASDSPQLDTAVIVDAFKSLETCDMVIGRVLDGGYYLVGQRGFNDVLSHVPMSTSSAADALIETATGRGLSIGELRPDLDVDVEEDLWLLFNRLQPDGKKAPATFEAIKNLLRGP